MCQLASHEHNLHLLSHATEIILRVNNKYALYSQINLNVKEIQVTSGCPKFWIFNSYLAFFIPYSLCYTSFQTKSF